MVSRLARRQRTLLRNVLRGGFWCGAMSTMWTVLSIEVQHRQEGVFVVCFAMPLLLSLTIGLYTMRTRTVDAFLIDPVARKARARFQVGVSAALVGALCWLFGELLCDEFAFFRWFPGHVVWHVSMSWGLMQTLIYGTMLRANNHNAHPRFVEEEAR